MAAEVDYAAFRKQLQQLIAQTIQITAQLKALSNSATEGIPEKTRSRASDIDVTRTPSAIDEFILELTSEPCVTHPDYETIHGTLGTLAVGVMPESPFTFSREIAPKLWLGDVIALRAIDGSVMRMECVEMTTTTLTFQEVKP